MCVWGGGREGGRCKTWTVDFGWTGLYGLDFGLDFTAITVLGYGIHSLYLYTFLIVNCRGSTIEMLSVSFDTNSHIMKLGHPYVWARYREPIISSALTETGPNNEFDTFNPNTRLLSFII